jgi:hypothetical protein
MCRHACVYAFYAFYAWWVYFPQSGALAEGTSQPVYIHAVNLCMCEFMYFCARVYVCMYIHEHIHTVCNPELLQLSWYDVRSDTCE